MWRHTRQYLFLARPNGYSSPKESERLICNERSVMRKARRRDEGTEFEIEIPFGHQGAEDGVTQLIDDSETLNEKQFPQPMKVLVGLQGQYEKLCIFEPGS